MSVAAGCTVECTRTPDCAVCGRQKKLAGRDYPAAMGGGYCDWSCPGYDQPPLSGHLWPSEWREREAEQAADRWLYEATDAEVDAELRRLGLDPAEVRAEGERVAREALVKRGRTP